MHNRTNIFAILCLLIGGLALAACGARQPSPSPPIRELLFNFFAIVKDAPAEEVQLELGLSGVTLVPADPAFAGRWELRDDAGDLRAAGEIVELAEFAGERVLVIWQGRLDPGRYTLTWGAPAYGGLVKRFEIVTVDGRLQLGDHQEEFITTGET
jgi:hypothetical protein